jgi:hypothetical protein
VQQLSGEKLSKNAQESHDEKSTHQNPKEKKREMRTNFMTSAATFYRFSLSQ